MIISLVPLIYTSAAELTKIMTGRWNGTLGSSLSMYCHVLHRLERDNKHIVNEIIKRKRNHA